jgi:hypothetical protein
MGKITFFWLIKKAKKVVYQWIIAVRCDSFFCWSKRQRRLFMDGNIELKCDISAEDDEKGRIWTKSGQKWASFSASGWERFLFWLIKEAKKVIDGSIIDQKCDYFYGWSNRQRRSFMDPKCDVSADLDQIRPNMSLIFCWL